MLLPLGGEAPTLLLLKADGDLTVDLYLTPGVLGLPAGMGEGFLVLVVTFAPQLSLIALC